MNLPLSPTFRLIFLIGAILVTLYMAYKVRKGQVEIRYSLFWVLVSFFLLLTAIWPDYIVLLARLFGISSTSNMIFLLAVFVLGIRLFMNAMDISELHRKIEDLTQNEAINRLEQSKTDGDQNTNEQRSSPNK